MMYILCILLGLGTLALDQWVKWWTVNAFAAPAVGFNATADPAQSLLPGVVELTRVHNYGAAWSSFSGMRWVLVVVTSLIVLAAAFVAIIVTRIMGRKKMRLKIFREESGEEA